MHISEIQFSVLLEQNWLIFFWIVTYIFKVFRNDFDSYCKDLTQKVMVFFKV